MPRFHGPRSNAAIAPTCVRSMRPVCGKPVTSTWMRLWSTESPTVTPGAMVTPAPATHAVGTAPVARKVALRVGAGGQAVAFQPGPVALVGAQSAPPPCGLLPGLAAVRNEDRAAIRCRNWLPTSSSAAWLERCGLLLAAFVWHAGVGPAKRACDALRRSLAGERHDQQQRHSDHRAQTVRRPPHPLFAAANTHRSTPNRHCGEAPAAPSAMSPRMRADCCEYDRSVNRCGRDCAPATCALCLEGHTDAG